MEIVVWRVPVPVKGSRHEFKYSLVLISDRICVLRYDNEAGKGDHKHIGEEEVTYSFSDFDSLLRDFWEDVETWREQQ